MRNTWYARFSKVGSADRHAVFDEMKDNRSDEARDNLLRHGVTRFRCSKVNDDPGAGRCARSAGL